MKRAIVLDGTGIELPLSKATAVKTGKKMIHIDELPDGTWRLIYSQELIPDFTKISAFRVLRED
jgi:hypothetical protein